MRHRLVIGDASHDIGLVNNGDGYRLLVDNAWHRLAPAPPDAVVVVQGDTAHVHLNGRAYAVHLPHPIDILADASESGGDRFARAPMPGAVVTLNVSASDVVTKGDAMVIIESMKLETVIRAVRDGTVEDVHYAVGESFERDATLVTLAVKEA